MGRIYALALILLAGPAAAQNTQCGPTPRIEAFLTQQHGESVIFQGLSGASRIRLFLNPESGSWTAVADSASGVTCLVASGQAGTAYPVVMPGDPA
jgi:hypothetical protein